MCVCVCVCACMCVCAHAYHMCTCVSYFFYSSLSRRGQTLSVKRNVFPFPNVSSFSSHAKKTCDGSCTQNGRRAEDVRVSDTRPLLRPPHPTAIAHAKQHARRRDQPRLTGVRRPHPHPLYHPTRGPEGGLPPWHGAVN